MESKHFSHHHPLLYHQVLQGSQTHCSGCKSPASGNVYVCWKCSYFLHDQCFRAQRSLNHPSHPLHPLSLVPFPTYSSASFFCNSCSLAGDGFSYSCSACEFDIHLHCALTPNPNPQLPPQYYNNPHTQTPIYPPPLQTGVFPTYPSQNYPQSQTTNNPSPNTTLPNQTHNYCTNPPPGYPQPNAAPQNFTPTTSPPPQPTPLPSNNPQSKPLNIIKHFSHPHAFKQMEIEAENANLCSACELRLSGSAYCCTEPHCSFSLHKPCFDSPRELRHKSHPHHPLTLLPAPPYSNGSFTCDACRKSGKGFAYTCSTCSHDLHIDCIRWPETVTRPDHKHSLALYYKSPFAEESVFVCSVCAEAADDKAWVYYCRDCDFGTHLECVNSEIKPQNVAGAGGGEGGSIQEELLKLQQQKMNLDFQMQMAKQQAEFMTSIANSWKNFF